MGLSSPLFEEKNMLRLLFRARGGGGIILARFTVYVQYNYHIVEAWQYLHSTQHTLEAKLRHVK